jgi:transcriptional regulator with XRE-family HTH domain
MMQISVYDKNCVYNHPETCDNMKILDYVPKGGGVLTRKEKNDQVLRAIKVGEYLAKLRAKKGLSLATLSKELIEKGKKIPADELLRGIANYHNIPEAELFQRFGKIPLQASELLESMPELQMLLARMESDKKLTKEQKYDFMQEIERVYTRYIRGD